MIEKEKLMLRDGALKNEVIIITGGGTGLGRSMAECFSLLGAKVSIWGRRQEVVEKTAAEISSGAIRDEKWPQADASETVPQMADI